MRCPCLGWAKPASVARFQGVSTRNTLILIQWQFAVEPWWQNVELPLIGRACTEGAFGHCMGLQYRACGVVRAPRSVCRLARLRAYGAAE